MYNKIILENNNKNKISELFRFSSDDIIENKFIKRIKDKNIYI